MSRFARRFSRRLSPEAQKLKDEIAAIPVTDEEAAAAKLFHDKFMAVIQEALAAGVDTIPICAGLGSAAGFLGHHMCDEKGPGEDRGTWLAFFAMVVSESLQDAHATEVAERLGAMLRDRGQQSGGEEPN